jgi:hypothetical protein
MIHAPDVVRVASAPVGDRLPAAVVGGPAAI